MKRICWTRPLFKLKRLKRKGPILKLKRSKRHCKRPSFNWKRRKRWKRSIQLINYLMEWVTTQEDDDIQANDDTPGSISIQNRRQPSDSGNQDNQGLSTYNVETQNGIQANGDTPGSISIQNRNRGTPNSWHQNCPKCQNNANLDIESLSNPFVNQCNIHPYRPADPTPNQRQSLKWKKQKRQVAQKRQRERKKLERQEMWKRTIQQPSDDGNQDSPEGLSQYQPTISHNDFRGSISTGTGFCPNPSETSNVNIETLNNFNELTVDFFKTRVLYKEQIDTLTQLSPEPLPYKWLSITDIKGDLEPGPYLIEQDGLTHPVTGEVINLHCTSLIVFKDCPWEYFDSRGIPLHDIPGIKINSNDIRFQHPHYNTCGFHAVYFPLARYKLGSMEEVQQSYPTQSQDSLLLNDQHILAFFKELYQNYLFSKLMVQTTNYLSLRSAA